MTHSRPSKLRTGILTIALSGTLFLGCAIHTRTAHDARAAMVGMDERRLLSRLGPPDDFAFARERRYFLYRLDLRRRAFLFKAPDPSRLAFCNLLFRIDRGVVTNVRVRSVAFSGLKADARCMIIASEALKAFEYTAPETAKALAPSVE